jgi:hypothetical protein
MLNIVSENPFDVYTDKILRFKYQYFIMKKHFLYTLNLFNRGKHSSTIPIFNSDDVKVGDKFRLNVPNDYISFSINLPDIDIFGTDIEFRIISISGAEIEIVSPDDDRFSKININHQFPNIVERIS